MNKILVVDDVPANIQVMNQALSGQYEVVFATSGPEGLEMAALHLPDLILLDVKMGNMDGFQMCQTLKRQAETQDIPVIFVTALDDTHEEARGFEVGGVDYITKPVSPPILLARVKTHLELKSHRDMLARQTITDGLTAITNRRGLDQRLAIEWNRCQRNKQPLSLIMVDVDHFKQFNDTYGHQLGDDCLRLVAHCLEGQLMRAADLVGRYGGEEFLCLLPESPVEEALVVAERLRKAVAGQELAHAQSPTSPFVTISLGVASVYPNPKMRPEDLIKAADEGLYQAKAAGRNRTASQSLR